MPLSGECISPHENEQKKINAACFKDRCYTVELAGTDEERKSGLMWREHLDVDRGMLFVYPVEGVYVFWMKNTLIPLDIIWLAADGTAVYISKNAEPCTGDYCPAINPNKKARYVLEINAGEAERIGLTEGDRMNLVWAS